MSSNIAAKSNEIESDVIQIRPKREKKNSQSSSSNNSSSPPDYLNEYDEFYLDNEKHIRGGQGGKQRNKQDQIDNQKANPAGNTRKITSSLQNFEHNRNRNNNNNNK
jgi:hypothetical protein